MPLPDPVVRHIVDLTVSSGLLGESVGAGNPLVPLFLFLRVRRVAIVLVDDRGGVPCTGRHDLARVTP